MGLIFVAATADWDPEPDSEPVARVVPLGGVYFSLYPRILALRDETGQLIDTQQTAFFSGDALRCLRAFVEESRLETLERETQWQQRVGRHSSGEIWYETTSRDDVIGFLDQLTVAVEQAERRDAGLLFVGE